MKKVMLVFVIVFSILILLSVSMVFAEDPEKFIEHCKSSGCFIHKLSGVSNEGCGTSPEDIKYILTQTNCANTTICSGNGYVTTITSDSLPGSAHNDCKKEVKTSCAYTTNCDANHLCKTSSDSTVSCVPDIELNDVNFTDSGGVIIMTARINDSINMRALGKNMKLGGALTYEIFRDGNSIRSFTRDSDSETEDNYPWLAGFNGTNYTAGVYNFSVSVGGHEITSESLTIPLLSLSEVYFANATTGDKLAGARLNTAVNLTVIGTDLIGREIKYEILNEGVLVRTFLHTATSDTEDSVNWTLGEIGDDFFAGQYTFNASVSALGINRTSENTLIIPELGAVYFTDLRDIPIPETEEVGLNSEVKLNVSGFFLEGEYITYEIWEKDAVLGFIDWRRKTISGDGVVTWRAGTDEDGNLRGGNTYYFIARTDDDPDLTGDVISPITGNVVIKKKQSGDLKVSNTQNNIPPVAQITNPEDQQIYFMNETLNFTQESYDLDDSSFSYEWELNNGTETIIKKGNSSNLENYNFTYAYKGKPNLGQQNIKLTVTDERGESSTDTATILITNSTYILAYTDTPIDGRGYGRVVSYDSRSTYAVSSTTGDDQCTKTITCEAGNCPAATRGCPPCYDGLEGRPGPESCPINVINSPPTLDDADYTKIEFCWIFDDEVNEEVCAFGISGALFEKSYTFIGMHTSRLEARMEIE